MGLFRLVKLKHVNYFMACITLYSVAACSGGGGSSVPLLTFGDLNVSWAAPLEREDGTTLDPSSEIVEYRVYYGTVAGDYQNQIDIDGGLSSQAQVLHIPSGKYFVVVTAIDADGRESLYSTEAIISV